MALTDAFGKLADVRVLPGQAPDLRGCAALIERVCCGRFLADRAFDAKRMRDPLTSVGVEPVIPPRSSRRFPAKFDRHICKWRHLIENVFGTLQDDTRIAMRCCRTHKSFGAFIAIAATIIRLR